MNKYLFKNYFGARARYPHIRWNYHQLIFEKKSFQLSTNGIESINRSIKHYLGLGNCNQDRLDREMNLYHRQKVNAASAALNHGRMKKIRRETLAHQDSLFKSLKDFESLSEHNKLKNLKYHLLDCGTYTSDVCDPKYFDILPVLDEIEIEPLSETILIPEKSFLDSTLDDISPLEVIPESTELPSFLGTDFGARQSQKSGRITR